jgi:hypothetical protein
VEQGSTFHRSGWRLLARLAGLTWQWRESASPRRAGSSSWPAPPQPSEDDLDLDREIEYAFDTEEPMAGRTPGRAPGLEGDGVDPRPRHGPRQRVVFRRPGRIVFGTIVATDPPLRSSNDVVDN